MLIALLQNELGSCLAGISDIFIVGILTLGLLLLFAYIGIDTSQIWSPTKMIADRYKQFDQQFQKPDLGNVDPLCGSLSVSVLRETKLASG